MRMRIPGVFFEAVAEATASAGGGEAAETGDPAGEVVEPEAVEVVEEPEAAAPAFDYESPEFQAAAERAAQARLDAYIAEQNRPEPEDPNAALLELDPLDPNYAQELARILGERDQRLIAQFRETPAVQHADAAYAQQWGDAQFATIEKAVGGTLKPNARELAIAAANGIVEGVGDPARALGDVGTKLHQLIQSERAEAVAQYQAGLGGDGTPAEPAPGAAAGVRMEPKPGSYDEILNRHGLG